MIKNPLATFLVITFHIPCYFGQSLVTLDGIALSIQNNLTITINGGLTNQDRSAIPGSIANSGIIKLTENWTNNASNGVFTTNKGTVEFSGNTSQIIDGTNKTDFYNLTLNNTFLSHPSVSINIDAVVKNCLTMLNGNFHLSGFEIRIGSSSISCGEIVYTNGWICGGTITRWFPTAVIGNDEAEGLFPIGSEDDYRPLKISYPLIPPLLGGTISVTHFSSETSTNVSISDDFVIERIQNSKWDITNSGISGGSYNLIIGGTGLGLIGNVNDLRATQLDTVVGSPGTNTGTILNPLVNRTGISLAELNGGFFIGTIDLSNSPLPVTWIDFSVEKKEQFIEITWRTSSEINNDYFTIERSVDVEKIETITTIQGAGNSNKTLHYTFRDELPLEGVSYYRLKQTDYDGKFEYSDWKKVRVEASNTEYKFDVFPNPSHKGQNLNLRFENNFNEEILVIVMDILGKEYFSKVFISESNDQIFAIDPLENLTPGIYIVTGSSKNRLFSKKLVVK